MAGITYPLDASNIARVYHGEKVGAVAFASPYHLFTAGLRSVKVWDIESFDYPVEDFGYNDGQCRIKTIKISPDGRTIAVGRYSSEVAIWDITAPSSPLKRGDLNLGASTCRDLAISHDSKLCFSCDANGKISVWDLHNRCRIWHFHGKVDGATCIDVTSDGTTLCTGSAFNIVRSWDLRNYKIKSKHGFTSAIFSISCNFNGELIVVGMNDCRLEIIDNATRRIYRNKLHEFPVQSLKLAHSGKWFVSGGDGQKLIGSTVPEESCLFQKEDTDSVTCCDISTDDAIIVTGSGMYGNVYRVEY